MFTLFFTIIFIAELIIAIQIIALIKNIDSKVLELNAQIASINPIIKNVCTETRIAVNKFYLAVNRIAIFIEKKKQEYINSIIKNLLTGVLFMVLSQNGKKALATADLIMSVDKFMKGFA